MSKIIEKCPFCGAEIPSNVEHYTCPKCYMPVHNRKAAESNGKFMLVLIGVVAGVLMLIGGWAMLKEIINFLLGK